MLLTPNFAYTPKRERRCERGVAGSGRQRLGRSEGPLRRWQLRGTSKKPKVLFNVGVCERQLRHYARAADRLRQELAEGSAVLSPDEVVELSKVIAALEPFIGSVNMRSNEPGVKVLR